MDVCLKHVLVDADVCVRVEHTSGSKETHMNLSASTGRQENGLTDRHRKANW